MIFAIMGKSGSGKDSVLKQLMKDSVMSESLHPLVTYTTRPMRPGETEGVEYHFVSAADFSKIRANDAVLEYREYETENGIWTYFTVLPEDYKEKDYIVIASPKQAISYKRAVGADNFAALYITVADSLRIQRCLSRELEGKQDFKEMCRRYLADETDFTEEVIKEIIPVEIDNTVFRSAVEQVKSTIIDEWERRTPPEIERT